MSGDRVERIMDAAEQRLCASGYNGFSFRDLAEDVGVKSSSVHYHFPTKEALVSALIQRYTSKVLAQLDGAPEDLRRIQVLRDGFRSSLDDNLRMCIGGVLSAERTSLPEQLRIETRVFFEQCVNRLAAALNHQVEEPHAAAVTVFAQLQGAVILARAFGDVRYFDEATSKLIGVDRGP